MSSMARKPMKQYGANGPAMHKSEEDFIYNWMNKLRTLRSNGVANGRIVRCRKSTETGSESLRPGTKRVHFVRHGEGHHNVHSTRWFDEKKKGNPWQHASCPIDPGLTDLGVTQAKELNERSERELGAGPQVVVVSPLLRTLQTATLGFDYIVGKVPFVAQEDCREIMGQHRCDRRVSPAFRASSFPHVDFSGLEDHDPVLAARCGDPTEEDLEATAETDAVFNAVPNYAEARETDEAAVGRALDFLFWIRDRPEQDICVVTHSAFLCVAFNGAMMCDCEDLQSWFSTGEIRSVDLTYEA